MAGGKKRKLALALVMIVVALILVNIIFGFVITGPDRTSSTRCVYSLLRVGVALVEYCNINNTTVTPPSLQVLVDEGIINAGWLRDSELGSRFGYFGQFDLLGPRPPVILWSKSEQSMEYAGALRKVIYAVGPSFKPVRYSSRLFEEELGELDAIREVLGVGATQGDVESLLQRAAPAGDSPTRPFAIWKLAQMHRKDLEKTFLDLLQDDDTDVRYEAAHALALLGNPAAGASLLARLRDSHYFERLRAFKALERLAGADFGFNPALDPDSQPAAIAKFDQWWAKTASSLRLPKDDDAPK